MYLTDRWRVCRCIESFAGDALDEGGSLMERSYRRSAVLEMVRYIEGSELEPMAAAEEFAGRMCSASRRHMMFRVAYDVSAEVLDFLAALA